jgi:hypothetical protein
MKKILFLSMMFLFIFQILAFSQNRALSPQTHFYSVEYIRGEKIKCHTLDIRFFIKATAQQAEEILRSQLNFIVKNFPPSIDILATAWYSTSSDYYEGTIIPLPNGKEHLAYTAKTKKIDYM